MHNVTEDRLTLLKKLTAVNLVSVCCYDKDYAYYGKNNVYLPVKLEDVSTMSYDNYSDLSIKIAWHEDTLDSETDFILLDCCTYSDYSGSLIEASNCQAIKKLCKEEDIQFWEVHGGFGTNSVAVPIDFASDELEKVLEALLDYGLIDEDLYSELQFQAEVNSYDDNDKQQFVSEIEKEYDGYSLEFVPESDLRELFLYCMEESNEYYINEQGDQVWINIQRLVSAVTETKLQGLNGIKFNSEVEDLGIFNYDYLESQGQKVLVW